MTFEGFLSLERSFEDHRRQQEAENYERRMKRLAELMADGFDEDRVRGVLAMNPDADFLIDELERDLQGRTPERRRHICETWLEDNDIKLKLHHYPI